MTTYEAVEAQALCDHLQSTGLLSAAVAMAFKYDLEQSIGIQSVGSGVVLMYVPTIVARAGLLEGRTEPGTVEHVRLAIEAYCANVAYISFTA